MINGSTMKPAADEYAPYYARYIDLVPSGDIIVTLQEQMADTLAMLGGLTPEKALYRYAPEKWSIQEVLGHIVDGERIFSYRALRFARGDSTPLAGFEQEGYVMNGGFHNRRLSDLMREYEHVRGATIDLFEGMSEEAWGRRGTASEAEVSVRAMAWIISGHELHHKGVIRTRYLSSLE